MWPTVLLGAAGCFALKYLGAALPSGFVDHPIVKRIVLLLPIALLSALVAVQTAATRHDLVVDARLPALGVAIGVLGLRRSFVEVVLAAALTAAGLRHFGLMA